MNFRIRAAGKILGLNSLTRRLDVFILVSRGIDQTLVRQPAGHAMPVSHWVFYNFF